MVNREVINGDIEVEVGREREGGRGREGRRNEGEIRDRKKKRPNAALHAPYRSFNCHLLIIQLSFIDHSAIIY